jgi:hypothetical protein
MTPQQQPPPQPGRTAPTFPDPASSPGDTTARFLNSMASPDPAVRQAAGAFARRRGAAVIVGLGDLAAHSDNAIAKSAKQALGEITHYAARPGAGNEARAVAAQLLVVANDTARPRAVRAHALHLLGFVAGDAHVPALGRLLADHEIGQDARMALERIGSSAARRALANVAKQTSGV